MGWSFELEDVAPADEVRVLRAQIEQAKARVKLAYQGLATREALQAAIGNLAKEAGAFMKDTGNNVWTLNAKPAAGAPTRILLKVTYKPSGPSRPGTATPVPCPSCRKTFIPTGGPNGTKWTEAHNVIPASLWFVIVPEAILRMLARTPPDADGHHAGVLAYLSKLDYRRKGFKDGVSRGGPAIDLFLSTLCRAGADTDGPGASGPQPETGAQCPTCEALHADRSLICRVKSFSARVATGQLATEAIGDQFIKYLDRHKGSLGHEHSAELITRAVAEQVLARMYATSNRGTQDVDHGNWLKSLLRDNWQDFSDAVVTEAIRACAAQPQVT